MGRLIGAIIGALIGYFIHKNRRAKNTSKLESYLEQRDDFILHSILGHVAFDVQNRQIAISANDNKSLVVITSENIESIESYTDYKIVFDKRVPFHTIKINIHDFENPFYTITYPEREEKLRDLVYSKISNIFNLS